MNSYADEQRKRMIRKWNMNTGPFMDAFSGCGPLLRPTPKRDTIVTFALVLSFWLVGFVLGILAYASYIDSVSASMKPSIEIVP